MIPNQLYPKTEFQTDDRVHFKINEDIEGNGTILGKAMEHVIDFYIVLLDKPITYPKDTLYRAALVQNTLMEKLDPRNDPTKIEKLEFKCPKCGSYMFGSSGNSPNLTRYCHGDEYHSCNFKFHQKDDDKYFFPSGKFETIYDTGQQFLVNGK